MQTCFSSLIAVQREREREERERKEDGNEGHHIWGGKKYIAGSEVSRGVLALPSDIGDAYDPN
jgi:hypothetical protein